MSLERAKALFFEGLAHHNHQRFESAETCYRQALDLMPERVSVLTNLGAVLVAQSRFDEARIVSERALVLEPDNAECRALLEACLHASVAPARRLALQEHALQQRPDDASAHEALGATLLEQGAWLRAKDCYSHALRLNPDSQPAVIGYAQACEASGRHDEALDVCLGSLERMPDALLVAQVALRLLLAHGLPATTDPRVNRLLAEGLKAPLINPQQLALLVLTSLRDALPAPMLPDAVLVEKLAQLPMLNLLLGSARASDPGAEALLVRARRHLMVVAARANDAMPGAGMVDFCCALARQAWLNEYCWPRDADEETLLGEVRSRLAGRAEHSPMALLALASYEPVAGLWGADWAQRLKGLPATIAGTIAGPLMLAENSRRHAAAVPVLTTIEDQTSLRVREQYEAHPYPRWSRLPTHGVRIGLEAFARQRIAGAPVFEASVVEGSVRALNAGCGTGQHPVDMALRVARLDLLAVDLSRNSLGFAAAMAALHGIETIRFAQADLLQLPALGYRFDYVECAGVVHHMADPDAGLAALAQCLAPRGLLRIALYSSVGRRGINACRQWLAERGTGHDDAAIRALRRDVLALPEGDPRRDPARFVDFYATSDCRDLLLHVQEAQFDPVAVAGMLQRNGLRLLGFEVPPRVLQRFQDESPGAAADDPLAWKAFEQRHPDAFEGMIFAWAQAPDRA